MTTLTMQLHPTQQLAVSELLHEIFERSQVLLTKIPGMGLMTIIKAVKAELEAEGKTCLIGAPTGRGAHLLRANGVTCDTVHSLMQTEGEPVDVLVVMDADMLRTDMVGVLPKLAKHVVLVVDEVEGKLPGVGPGSVLDDLHGATERNSLTCLQLNFRRP